jgi:hypothetical protein
MLLDHPEPPTHPNPFKRTKLAARLSSSPALAGAVAELALLPWRQDLAAGQAHEVGLCQTREGGFHIQGLGARLQDLSVRGFRATRRCITRGVSADESRGLRFGQLRE